jgi:hypothetical protein
MQNNKRNLQDFSRRELINKIEKLEKELKRYRQSSENNNDTRWKHMGRPVSKYVKIRNQDGKEEEVESEKLLGDLSKEWEMEDRKAYISKKDRKRIHQGVSMYNIKKQAQSPEKKRRAKRKPSNPLKLTEPKRQDVEYEVGNLVEVANTNKIRTFYAEILLKGPGKYDFPDKTQEDVPKNSYLVRFDVRKKFLWDIVRVGRRNANTSGDYILRKVKEGYDELPKNFQRKLRY